jgi:segregation and condensation protein B
MASLAEKRKADAEENSVDPHARPEELRLLEALLFASAEPLDQATLAKRMPEGVDVKVALTQLQADYASRGVNLVRIANKWTFRTAGDLSWLMTRESTETRRLSRAAIEMLAIIAYHQPVTRAEIEEIRGVITSKGTLDVLLETGWIRPRGRRKTPGRPLTFGTTEAFLSQFSLEALGDLPGLWTRGCLPVSVFPRPQMIRRCATTRIRLRSAIWNLPWPPRSSRKPAREANSVWWREAAGICPRRVNRPWRNSDLTRLKSLFLTPPEPTFR